MIALWTTCHTISAKRAFFFILQVSIVWEAAVLRSIRCKVILVSFKLRQAILEFDAVAVVWLLFSHVAVGAS